MTISLIVLLVGYVSLVTELVFFAVPSVASTWQLAGGKPSQRWALAHLLPTVVAVTGFAAPALLVGWCTPASESLGGAILVIGGRTLTMLAVVALRRRAPAQVFVADGPYACSRNPALLGLHLFLLGGVLIVTHPMTVLGFLVFVIHMHRRVRTEEAYLLETGGAAFAHYVQNVPRYIPSFSTGRRRVPPP